MDNGYDYVIKLGRFFIGREFETGRLFMAWINKNGSYREIFLRKISTPFKKEKR